ncbi:MAG: M48 family metallopeptidase [Burkholderiales bacterium]
MAGIPRMVAIPNAGQLEIADHAAFDEVFAGVESRALDAKVWSLENRWGIALGALAATILIVLAVVQYGLPWAAREIATRLPPASEKSLGERTLQTLDQTLLAPSMVDGGRITRLRERFAAMTVNLNDGFQYRLEIRAAPGVGPNAFALPGGIIVFTDELILLAKSDAELAAVLAHEIGHVRGRHTMRHTIQNSVTTLLIAALTGDLLNASSWAATLPAFTLQAKYSRDFEREADRFAIDMLRSQGIAPSNLGTILRSMEAWAKSKGGGARIPDWLSTHPSTEEREAASQEQ